MTAFSFLGRTIRFVAALALIALILLNLAPFLFGLTLSQGMGGRAESTAIWLYATLLGALVDWVSFLPMSTGSFPARVLAPSASLTQEQIGAGGAFRAETDGIARLRIIGVSYSDRRSAGRPGEIGRFAGQASVQLSAAPERAVVFVSNDSVRWSFSGPPGRQARLGFHGAAPADMIAPPGGAIAEFRLYEASGDAVGGPLYAANAPADVTKRFCQMISAWRSHFGLRAEDVDYIEFASPRAIVITELTATADGRYGTYLGGKAISQQCR